MDEKSIELTLGRETARRGGLSLKWVSPGRIGVPDRIVMLPGGHVGFVELKATGKKPRPSQVAVHREFKALGFPVYVVDAVEQIGGVLDAIQAT